MAVRLTADQKKRLTREAMADVDTGQLVDHETVLAWAESLGTERPLSAPKPKMR
jgi:predicted transcriptional regulator